MFCLVEKLDTRHSILKLLRFPQVCLRNSYEIFGRNIFIQNRFEALLTLGVQA